MGPMPETRHSAAARLDRLPIATFHRRAMRLLGYVFFFELGDINTFGFAAPAIREAWGLSISTIGFVTSATFIGMFLGATSAGWISDRIGRKRALILTTLWYSGFSLLNAFAWNTNALLATRLLTGVGLSGATVVAITYISEMFPAAKRGAYQGWIMTIGLCGIPVTAYVARFLIPMGSWGWRGVFVWGSLGLLFPLFARHLEESPRWHEHHGRLRDADAALDRIEQQIRNEIGQLPPIASAIPVVTQERASLHALVAGGYLKRMALFIAIWIFQTLGFYGFMSWVPTLLAANGFSVVHALERSSAISIGAVPGAWIAAKISDRWERKWLITGVSLVVACCGLIYGLSFSTVPIVIFGFLVAMFIQTFAPLLYAYTPESFPTSVRNTSTGVGYGIGRLANAFGPLFVAFLYTNYGYTSVFVYIAICWSMVALLVGSLGPRTKGHVLT